jgi:hypothetical protein
MDKIYVRAVERYTVWEATQPIEVNVEKLRQCEPPFEGETEQDLLEYLRDNVWNNEDWADENGEIYGNDDAFNLTFIEAYDKEVYSDTRDKYEQSWLDVGVPNDEYRKMGRFEVIATNVDDVWKY